nr:NADH dehydrogenase subunit 6 [Sphaerodactylus elegans]
MLYVCLLFMLVVVFGLIGVAASPSPVFGAMGLVVAAAAGCGVLGVFGGSFISLILFLVYLGGMLVVFAYSVALAADSHPEAWGGQSVLCYVLGYVCLVGLGVVVFGSLIGAGGYGIVGGDWGGGFGLRLDLSGVVLLYSSGWVVLLLCGWGLVLALFVVVELTWGRAYGSLRAVI